MKNIHNNKRIDELRDEILRAFPPEVYNGPITPYDDELDDPNLDDEKDLHLNLRGKKWTDIPAALIENQPDGYALLNNEAFAAFLAAWLVRSLDDMDIENVIRDFVVYAFTPRHDMVPDMTDYVISRIRVLKPKQRQVLRSLLAEFAERDPSSYQRDLARKALALFDGLDT